MGTGWAGAHGKEGYAVGMRREGEAPSDLHEAVEDGAGHVDSVVV